MKTLQSYLLGIRENPKDGWRVIYSDTLGKYLSDPEKLLNGVRVFGEEAMFEAIVTTSTKKLNSEDPIAYVLAVARQLWKESLEAELSKSKEELRLERAIRRVSEDNAELAAKIEEARRIDADNTI
jgi:hypothetical protein